MNREEVILEIQQRYRQSDRALNELQRRQWAAREALKLGRGGITIVSKALRISPNTIKRGIREIEMRQSELNSPQNAPIRKPGGGRKSNKSLLQPFNETSTQRNSTKAETESQAFEGSKKYQQDSSPNPTDPDST